MGYAAFVEREIFTPLRIKLATYDWPGPAMTVGHDLRGWPVATYVSPWRGSEGLFATASDIARLAAASMTGADQAVLSEAGARLLRRPVVTVDGLFGVTAEGYGLGHSWGKILGARLVACSPGDYARYVGVGQ